MPRIRTNSKQKIVQAAEALFKRHGIDRVTVEEISEMAGLSKVTFYKYFDNKLAVVSHILESAFITGQQKFDAILAKDSSFKHQVRELVNFKMMQTRQFSDEFINDLMTGPHFRERVKEMAQIQNQRFLKLFEQGQARGDIRPDLPIPFLLHYLSQLESLFTSEDLLAWFPKPDQRLNHVLDMFFFGISNRPGA